MTYRDSLSMREMALRSRDTPKAATRPARSSWLTTGLAFRRARRIRRPTMFRVADLVVFFMTCDFHTLDFYRNPALNVCEVHTDYEDSIKADADRYVDGRYFCRCSNEQFICSD